MTLEVKPLYVVYVITSSLFWLRSQVVNNHATSDAFKMEALLYVELKGSEWHVMSLRGLSGSVLVLKGAQLFSLAAHTESNLAMQRGLTHHSGD